MEGVRKRGMERGIDGWDGKILCKMCNDVKI